MNNSTTITPLTVTQLNNQVKTSLEHQYYNLNVIGEIYELNKHSSGHVYFKLKDEFSSVPSIMFSASYIKNNVNFQEGDKVILSGSATLYIKRGTYQLTAKSIKLFNQKGDIYKKYEELKKRLDEEGIFKEEYKRKIPRYPLNIGIVTSLDGSVIQDIFNICKRRSQNTDLIVSASSVQGEDAPLQLVSAIDKLVEYDKDCKIDVIIIARGGGSFEDISCFNDEILARKIFELKIPVISAIGHETDFTIIDFVSDLRASTPSVAAELSTPDDRDIFQNLDYIMDKMLNCVSSNLNEYRQRHSMISQKIELHNPKLLIDNYKIKLENIDEKIINIYKNINKSLHDKVKYYDKLLYSNNPYNILNRGFAVVLDQNSRVVKKIKNIKLDDRVNIRFSDGLISTKVESKTYKDE